MEEKPLVSVVFLTRNAGKDFKKTLETVLAQKVPYPFEILALDNESDDGTWELLGRYPEIKRSRVPRKNFLHGAIRNYAAGLAKGEVVVNLVGDALPVGKSWLLKLVGGLVTKGKKGWRVKGENKGAVAGVSGRQVPPGGLPISQEYFLLKSYPTQSRVLQGEQTEFGPGKIWFTNVCSAIPKWALREIPFPDMVMSEDQGWALAVLKKGWTLKYEPEAKVLHGHALTLSWLFRRNLDSGASLASLSAKVATVGSGKMWAYLAEEIRFAWRKRGLVGVAQVFPYEAVRWLGFQTGYRSWVPIAIKKHFSIVPWFYDRVES